MVLIVKFNVCNDTSGYALKTALHGKQSLWWTVYWVSCTRISFQLIINENVTFIYNIEYVDFCGAPAYWVQLIINENVRVVYCMWCTRIGFQLIIIINENVRFVYCCMWCTRIGFKLIIKENVRFVYTVHRHRFTCADIHLYTDRQHSGDASRLSHGKQCDEVTCGEMKMCWSNWYLSRLMINAIHYFYFYFMKIII